MKLVKRHIAKTFTWRIIASADTVLITYLISGDFNSGLKIASIEVLTKMILYYLHERFWFKSSVASSKRRHMYKTFLWRFIGTIDTMIISGLVLGSLITGGEIGITETFTKMILYYMHEELWYKLNYGLDKRNKIKKFKNRSF